MGFAVQSAITFRTLRAGGGARLSIGTLTGSPPEGEELITWRPREGNPFHGRLLRDGDRLSFWASDAGWYVIDPQSPSVLIERDRPGLVEELRLFGVPASLCASAAGDLAVHAAGVQIGGAAVLFAGPSMHGKTTLAAAFAARGHRLLTEDTARVSLETRPLVYPGPAIVRLRADVADAVTPPGLRRIPMRNGRIGMLVDPERRGDGTAVPLRAILLLRAGDDTRLETIPPATAARDLFALSFLLPLREHRAAVFARATDVASRIEVLNLYRPMSLAALDGIIERVERLVST
jgi:hypothetical protein